MLRQTRPAKLWIFSILAGCLFLALFVEAPSVLRAEQIDSSGGTGKPADNEREAESAMKPIGVPDYTKMTGFIESAGLPIEQPEVLWSLVSELKDATGKVATNPISNTVFGDGVLYFGDDAGNLTALSVESQASLWTHEHRHRISNTPSVDRDFVYFGSDVGITALRRDDGRAVWMFGVTHGASEATPLPVGDYIFASGYDGNSYCLKRDSGILVWKHNFVDDAPADPKGFEGKQARFQNIVARPNGAACDGKVFIQSVFDQSRVIALDCRTGKRRWTFQAAGWIGPAPTIANDRVYVASQDEHLYCLDLATGALIWKFKTESWLASRVAVHEGQVFLPAHRAKLYQLAADTGQLIRVIEPPDEADRDGAVYSFPILANKTAYFACGKGLFFAFDIESSKLRWKIRPSENSELFTDPTTDGHQIFVTTRPSFEQKGGQKGKQGESSIVAIGIER